jgi:hypothetical protein
VRHHPLASCAIYVVDGKASTGDRVQLNVFALCQNASCCQNKALAGATSGQTDPHREGEGTAWGWRRHGTPHASRRHALYSGRSFPVDARTVGMQSCYKMSHEPLQRKRLRLPGHRKVARSETLCRSNGIQRRCHFAAEWSVGRIGARYCKTQYTNTRITVACELEG